MAIKNKFIHFKTRAAFDVNVPNPTATADDGNQFYNYTTFIQDTKEIYTHGTFYKCDISEEEVEALIASKGYITEDDIPILSGGAAATSGQYVSGVTVSGHTVTVTKATLPSAATVAPKASGTAAVGTSTKYAREDHVHPSQTNVATATKLATPRVIAIAGAVSGSATFDGSTNISISTTLANIDASKITSGTLNADRLPEIPISKIPAAAMERLYVVESQSAAMSLTIQEGDVVQIGSGGPMYFCVSESASTFATKFKEFTAGSATSVPWSGVTGKPTFATVATSGSYNDLTNKPTIPSLSGYATQNWVTSQGYLTSIPAATSSAYGGIQIGYTTSDKNYAVQLSNGKAYVNVPWTDTNTNYYPTTFTWTNGTTAGPTGSLTGSGMSTVSFGAIPSASATQSGVVTTGDQSFAGEKIFRGGILAQDANISDLVIASSLEFNAFGRFNYIATSTEAGGIKIGATASGVNLPLVLNSSKQAYIAVTKGAVTAALGFTPANVNDIPAIPIALPNPYALTINGTSYTGSSAVSISTSKPLSVKMLTSSTVNAGYSYNCGTSKAISTLNGFSSTNPDSVIISSAKLTFTASNAIKMDGLDDLSGTWYIYCLSYMANGKIAVNGAGYA